MADFIEVIGPSIAYMQLSQGLLAVIDREDMERLKPHSWCAHRNTNKHHVRVVSTINRRTVHLGRFLLNPTRDTLVDHVSGNTLDNRRANLRIVTPKQNLMNLAVQRRSTTGVRGVTWRKDRGYYVARVREGVKVVWRGNYATLTEAEQAIATKHTELFGEYRRKA